MQKLGRSDLLVLGACILGPALISGLNSVFPLWVLPWTKNFEVPQSSVMLVYALTGLLTTLLMPFVGRLVVRVPARVLMAAGALVMGGGFLIVPLTTAFWQAGGVYAIAAAMGGVLCGPMTAQSLAFKRFPQHVGTIGGTMMIGLSLGGVVTPLLVAPLLQWGDWRTAMAIAGAAMLVIVPLLA